VFKPAPVPHHVKSFLNKPTLQDLDATTVASNENFAIPSQTVALWFNPENFEN
jgi:hypothetical protein